MAISIFFICVLSYGLGLLDTCGLVCRHVFQDEVRELRLVDYAAMVRRHRWRGALYALAGDLIRALITVLIGGMLLKKAGFPAVGKQIAMFMALLGQAVPLTDRPFSKQELVYPALLLLFVDWRVFLVCTALGLLVMALTGNRALMAAVAAVAMPVFTAIFGGWWLRIALAVFSAIAVIYCYKSELPFGDRFGGRPGSGAAKPMKDPAPQEPPEGPQA